jgi:hypothetical protein
MKMRKSTDFMGGQMLCLSKDHPSWVLLQWVWIVMKLIPSDEIKGIGRHNHLMIPEPPPLL